MPRLLSSTIFVTFAAVAGAPLANADMRDQVVCDVPADEAVLLTWQVDDGSWRVTTPSGGTASFPVEADALQLWREAPVFVCHLTLEVGFRELPGRLYRLKRSMKPLDRIAGVTHVAETDPRVLIAGPQFPPITADQTCDGKWLETSCWMELVHQPGCYVWNESLRRNETVAWTGACRGGTAHGAGSIIWSIDLGDLEWSDLGDLEGFGRFLRHDIVTTRLDGGRPAGHTDVLSTNGASAEGPYVNGRRHGTWIGQHADRSKYEGPYVDGQRHGTFTLSFPDGTIHEGPYENGLKEGTWVHRRADGIVEEGSYRTGRQNETWILRFPDGSVHEGRYCEGVQCGHWSRRDADGNESEGPLDDGKESGLWFFRFANGDVMEGSYVHGQRHGIWTTAFADGVIEKGRYVNGERQGTWIIHDGKFRYRTKYVDGRPKGKTRDAMER